MMHAAFTRRAAVAAAAIISAALLLVPSSASAGVITTIGFATDGPVTVAYGEDWFLRLSVASNYEEGPSLRLGPNDGTVDVYLSGVGGTFAAGLPIQPDGLVYVSQPSGQPLLAAGDYEVTAIYNPAPGGYYDTSQTATPLLLTVTPLEVVPMVEVVNDAAVSERPVITASLSGSYIDATGGAPAGTWHFVVTNSDDKPVFDENFALPQGATEPLRIEITSNLKKGESYSVTSAFSPVDEFVGGLTVGNPADSRFQTPSGTFGEAATAPVAVPPWAAGLILGLLVALATAVVAVAVRLRRRPVAASADSPPAGQRVPGEN